MSDTTLANTPIAELVPEAERGTFIPKLLPGIKLLIAEATVFDFMGKLCPAYGGGFWNYYRLSNGGYYMAPDKYGRMTLEWWGNGFSGEMSEDAAGIVATLFALSHLSFMVPNDGLVDNFEKLREFSYTHPESALISQAID